MTSVELRRKTSRPPGPEEPRGLGDPAVRVDPDRGAVLGEREVEALVRQARLGRVGLDERELDPRLGHHPPRRLELRRRDVDADRPRAALREPRREVRGAAAELDDVESRDVAEHAELGFVDPPDAPGDLVERPVRRGGVVRVLAVGLGPEREVLRGVAMPVHRGTRARSRAPQTRASPSRARGCSASRARTGRAAIPARRRPGSWRRSSCGRCAIAPSPSSDERERRPRRDEVDELAEERLLLVLGVVQPRRAPGSRRPAGPRARSARAARSAPGSRRRGCARRRPAWRGSVSARRPCGAPDYRDRWRRGGRCCAWPSTVAVVGSCSIGVSQ